MGGAIQESIQHASVTFTNFCKGSVLPFEIFLHLPLVLCVPLAKQTLPLFRVSSETQMYTYRTLLRHWPILQFTN